MDEVLDLSALEMAAAIRERRVSALEVTQATLARIKQRDEGVHAFVHVAEDTALARARAVDEQVAAGEPAQAGALLGVPVPIKDLTMVAGIPMQAGSAAGRKSTRLHSRHGSI